MSARRPSSKSKLHRSKKRRVRRNKQTGPLNLEALEHRRLLAGVTVSNPSDLIDGDTSSIAMLISSPGADNTISLREAITAANNTTGEDTITFAPTLETATITLGGTQLSSTEMLTIDASTLEDGLTIDANQQSRVLVNASGDSLTLRGLTITGGSTSGRGAGIYSLNGDVALENVVVTGNSSGFAGGGIWTRYGNVMLDGSLLHGNVSSGNGYYSGGGGIRTEDGDVTLTGSAVSGNTSLREGGGIYSFNGNVTLDSSVVNANSSTESHGGGISTKNGDLTVRNSTVSGNSAAVRGGGIQADDGSVLIESSTVTDNSAFTGGGGIEIQYVSSGEGLTIRNSIVAGNGTVLGSPDLAAPVGPGTNLDVSFSLIGSNSGTTLAEAQMADANGNLVGGSVGGVIDPLLGPLADNGGPTRTHLLLAGSPAMDAGDPSAVAGQGDVPDFDQRGAGFSRVLNNRIDMGALERKELPSLIVNSSTSAVDPTDFVTTLPEAINFANSSPGADTITLLTDVELTEVNSYSYAHGPNGLPLVTSPITIEGGGFTISRAATSEFRILQISDYGNLTLNDATISGGQLPNTADPPRPGFNGGGLLNLGTLTLNRSIVSGNSTALGETDANGGGVANLQSGVMTINDSVISNNTAYDYGGGFMNYSQGTMTINNSLIEGNEVVDETGGGGANIGTLIVTNSTFSGNHSEEGGGALVSLDFGAVSAQNEMTIRHSTIVGNDADIGSGGIQVDKGDLTVDHAMVTGNGGEVFVSATDATATSRFSLFGDSSQTDAGALVNFVPSATDITATSDGNMPTALSSILNTTLAGNGGPTMTHALIQGSPAENSGDPNAVAGQAGVPEFDQRGTGFSRIQNGQIDIGSLEQTEYPSLIVTTASDVVDPADFQTSLREAVAFANTNPGHDTITFDPAVFDGQMEDNIQLTQGQIEIDSTLTIDGAQTVTISSSDDSRIFDITHTGAATELSGLTLAGNREFIEVDGAGIRAAGDLLVSESTISGHYSFDLGGGIFANGKVTLQDSTVESNIAFFGAGIWANEVVVENSTIRSNIADSYGGGIRAISTTVTNSTISGNTADGDGGGIYTDTATVTNSAISGNDSTGYGGGIHTGVATITNSTIANNSATYGAAGLYGTNVTLRHTTISGNFTNGFETDGGGLHATTQLSMENSIVADNTSSNVANDIHFTGSVNDLVISHSLVGDNAGTTIVESQTPDANGNLVGSAAGAGVINPLLGALANNGGPTSTFALMPGSPALDAGDANAEAGMNGVPEFDQRGTGFERVSGSRIDMGAFELPQVPPTCDFDSDFDCDIDDIDAMIMEIAAGTNDLTFDLTGDDAVTLADRDQWLADAGEINLTSGNAYLLGDANLDGTVDGSDFLIWNANKFSATGKWSQGDWNADGTTDGSDFLIWNANKFQDVGGSSPILQPTVLGTTPAKRGLADGDIDRRSPRDVSGTVDELFALV